MTIEPVARSTERWVPLVAMRNVVKGGVWKNTEDEILKAAVMKYGKNQWARISSLLVRKSAKQCKARWYEWLDPNIKKIEWSREEEEKLLHLVKIMPNQWRTIAPVVGRTAAQCLEHYEKLLDKAQGKEEGEDEARKLRPGEIDPMPESKPAKPDPVDMDEDEKEMLQEARARLANTKGKKAKRKAREKQLDEARRLASQQKRREMKAAGMDVARRKMKVRGIDYNREIPFEHKPAPGFFDPSDELQRERLQKEFKPPALSSGADGPKRSQIEERNRRDDQRKMEDKKKSDLPAALAQLSRMNDPEQIRKRSKMALPEPQVSDRDLEDIAKLGAANEPLVDGATDEGAGNKKPTHMLLSRYDATPHIGPGASGVSVGATPLRSALPPPTAMRTPARPDTLLQEAQTLAAMAAAQTPLVGGSNPALSSDFGGITPARSVVATPSALTRATPRVRAAAAAVGSLSGMHTPLRDELHLNDERSLTSEESRHEEKQRQEAIRKQVKEALFKLPAPKNDYQIVVPSAATDEPEADADADRDGKQAQVADASDLAAEEAAKARAAQAELLRERTTALRRGLPRPLTVESSLLAASRLSDADLAAAEQLVRREMHNLLLHDAVHFPVSKAAPKLPVNATFERFTSEQLSAAEALVEAELATMKSSLPSLDAIVAAWDNVTARAVPMPGSGALVTVSDNSEVRVEALRKQFETVKMHVTREGKKAVKIEQKIMLLHGGYERVAASTAQDLEAAARRLSEVESDLACWRKLRAQELLAAPARVGALKEEVDTLKQREGDLQNRYADLLSELNTLQALRV